MSAAFNTEIDQQLAALQALPGIIWAPIRHHSPQCSWQLQCLIAQEKPDIILLEGPSEAQHLLPFMRSKDTHPPVAIYNYATTSDTSRQLKEENDLSRLGGATHYRCFIPFTAMSPEWAAIKAAEQHDIECQFIDLPYLQRLQASDAPGRYSSDSEPLLYDDTQLSGSNYVSTLLQQSECRDFDSWWERFFESGQQPVCAADFFSQMLTLCLLIRRDQTAQHEIDNETLLREHFMAEQIRQHSDAGKRCLVVCGGFHCEGIFRYLQSGTTASADFNLPSVVHSEAETNLQHSGIHLIPYSLARINKAADYSAGMPDSGYYHVLWQALQSDSESGNASAGPQQYSAQIQAELAAKLVSYLRSENQMVTLPDAIEAAVMAQRLAQLRGHLSGRREFRDALQSCFLKQAQDGSERHFNTLIDKFLSGNEVGRVSAELPLTPLLQDFHQQCACFKLPLLPAKESVKTLQIYRKDKHRQLSQLLYQLLFLDCNYAEQQTGPDFIQGKDLHLVRERWQLQWQPEVEAALIECAHFGNTLADAALNKLITQLRKNTGSGLDKVTGLLQALRMGLHKIVAPVCEDIQCWLAQEMQIMPLGQAFHSLSLCYHGQSALNARDIGQFAAMLSACYQRICIRLPWVESCSDAQLAQISEHLTMLAGTVNSAQNWPCQVELFYDALHQLLRREPQPDPQIRGLCLGILRRDQQISDAKMEIYIAQAFAQAYLSAQYCGDFLRGFLYCARAVFLDSPALMQMLNQYVMELDEQAFLAALPSLRFAFTTLSPRETFSLTQQLGECEAVPIVLGDSCPQSTLDNAYALRQQFKPLFALWGGDK